MDTTQNEKIKGPVNIATGEIKKATGRLIHDKDLESRGIIQKNKGEGQRVMGKIKEKISEGKQVIGNKMEKAGKRLQDDAAGEEQ